MESYEASLRAEHYEASLRAEQDWDYEASLRADEVKKVAQAAERERLEKERAAERALQAEKADPELVRAKRLKALRS
jgi:hypothetical protein